MTRTRPFSARTRRMRHVRTSPDVIPAATDIDLVSRTDSTDPSLSCPCAQEITVVATSSGPRRRTACVSNAPASSARFPSEEAAERNASDVVQSDTEPSDEPITTLMNGSNSASSASSFPRGIHLSAFTQPVATRTAPRSVVFGAAPSSRKRERESNDHKTTVPDFVPTARTQ
eukprot:29345-Pelagococcus_subviridis.AAC.2